jgi:NAD(P)-dependent dehydrogenase (short-subunit alcohol dehydrogenase family)
MASVGGENVLAGKVALVAGASRGAGRGIAVALGAAGATVYVTCRTTRALRSEMNRPETLEETAELVDQAGGRGIAVQVDHLEPDQVRGLVNRIANEEGILNILVNDIWGATRMEWNKTVWESSLDYGLRTLRLAVDTHAITSHFAAPLLIKRPGGLLVEVTDGTNEYNAANYRVSFFYDLAKAAVNRMAFSLGHELAPHGATAVAVTPGWLRSEAMLDIYDVTETNWRDATRSSRTLRSPRARHSSAVPSWRSPAIRRQRAGMGNRFPADSWRRFTVSLISTAASRMPGGISLRCRTPASRLT